VNGTAGIAIINLEDFTPFIQTVTCGTSNIGIQFSNSPAYSTAVADWMAGMAIITSGASLCGNDTTRSYYT
jgi:hypothetical protein